MVVRRHHNRRFHGAATAAGLLNGLRDHFEMPGAPIRLFLRSQAASNPYKNTKNWGTPSRLRKHLE
ncbi:MAG: hypothetical protein ACT4OK_11605 [Gemmobacter sp.]